jgi:hypothetical protein
MHDNMNVRIDAAASVHACVPLDVATTVHVCVPFDVATTMDAGHGRRSAKTYLEWPFRERAVFAFVVHSLLRFASHIFRPRVTLREI